jgi:hypothetical protein
VRIPGQLRQKIDWHLAELDPRDRNRRARRAAYDVKYNKCPHGTHDKNKCNSPAGQER